MFPFMRIFWTIFMFFVAIQKVFVPLYFWLLSITTAPEDTSELITDGRDLMERLNGNPVLDIVILLIGVLGLTATFGWGNWRLAIHRYYARQKLERLEQESRRIAEDIANTISQENQRISDNIAREWDNRDSGGQVSRSHFEQDGRYLAKHMMESASMIRRLDEIGYWRPAGQMHEIGVAGATKFAAESACKELYTAADRIKSDLQDGLITLLTQPRLPPGTE